MSHFKFLSLRINILPTPFTESKLTRKIFPVKVADLFVCNRYTKFQLDLKKVFARKSEIEKSIEYFQEKCFK